MNKWNLIVDVARCNGCFNCFVACKDEHVGNDFPGYAAAQPLHGHRWIDIRTVERGQTPMVDVTFLPTMCNHCDDAPCVRAGTGAVTKREDGIVLIDPVKARGRREIADACPYGAVVWNEEKRLAQKCTFCAHLLDAGWKEPRCAQVCATGAIRAVKLEDGQMQRLAESESLEVLHPQYGTRPRVYYRNLHRTNTCFVGATIVSRASGASECVRGAKVTLSRDDRPVAETETDGFGEFKIDRLAPGSGGYSLEIAAEGHERALKRFDLASSTYLGTIELAPDAR
ncbi:MAG: (4Fe-4S)-binding protein [Burkholderiales bacterium]|nr:(4Fe-4S)-binding protein [Burkholderiales bacterium]